ncbi:Csa1 family protein, partial [Staphylococcus epidermidis]
NDADLLNDVQSKGQFLIEILKGDGDLKGSSIGYKEIEFSFVDNKEQSIYFADSLEFNPSDVNNE